MKTKIYIVLLILITCTGKNSYAQNFTDLPAFKKGNSWRMFKSFDYETATWTIPTYIADFNTSPPVFHSLPLWAETEHYGHATAADTGTGALMFYTDSKTIWNRDFAPMPNGTGLSGDGLAMQGSCIVAKINDPDKYYVFTTNAYILADLRYSIVDMTLDGGKGDVIPTEKNILLDTGPIGAMMIAIPGSQCDVWLLVHPFTDPVFKAYHITEDGIDPDPVLSYTDTTLSGLGAYLTGQLAVSPDRSKIALTSNGALLCGYLGYYSSNAGGTLLAEFDPATGTVFNDTKLTDSVSFGVAFSPDGNLLYASDKYVYETGFGYSADTGRIYQYDVSDYPATVTLTNTDVLTEAYHGCPEQLRMLPNGHLLSSTMAYYSDPNESGAAAGLDTSYYTWMPANIYSSTGAFPGAPGGTHCLGNDFVFALGPDTTRRTTDTFFCKNGALDIDMAASGMAYTWNDGSTDSTRKITLPGKYWVSYLTDRCNVTVDSFIVAEYDPDVDLGDDVVLCGGVSHTFVPSIKQEGMQFLWSDGSTGDSLAVSQTGAYWVQTTIKNCIDRDTAEAVIFPSVEGVLGEDIAFCKGVPISLSLAVPAYPGASFLWNTGATTNTISVSDTGTYIVSVTIPPCNGEDSIRLYREVCECYFDVPTAFSPNNDGLNDLFTIAIEPGCPVQGYVLSVFNRYGQRLFIGWKPGDGWDGTHDGQAIDAGVYMYEIRFFGGTRQVLYTKKGDITLIR